MRKLFLILSMLLCASLARAQGQGNVVMTFSTGAYSGSCFTIGLGSDITNGNLYWCPGPGYTWTKLNGSGGPPTGAAGGDLSGTYPNPTVAKINGVTVPTLAAQSGILIDTAGTLSLATALPTGTTATTTSQNDNSTKVSTTAYVDLAVANGIAGVNPAVAVLVATTAVGDTSAWTYNNGAAGIGATFTGPTNTAITIDGVTFTTTGQRLLVKNDTQSPSGAFNGVYFLTALQTGITGAIFTRALDYDAPSDINNTGAIPVQSGTANTTTSWLLTSQVATVGTSPLTYSQFSYAPNSCGNLPALTGNVTSSAGSCATTVAAVPAAALPVITTWTPHVAGSANSGAMVQNQILIYAQWLDPGASYTFSHMTYFVSTTDNSGNNYDMGAYGPGCFNGATNVPRAFHTGTIAGTSFAPSSAQTNQSLSGAPISGLTPGWYCFAVTSSAASPVFKTTVTANILAPFAGQNIAGGGATLPTTITAPALSWSGTAMGALGLY